LGLGVSTTTRVLADLHERSLVLRTYRYPLGGDMRGNRLDRVELVDPAMTLPAPPRGPVGRASPKTGKTRQPASGPSVRPAVALVRETAVLEERTARQPSIERVVDALVERALELQRQVDKLHGVVEALGEENDRLRAAGRSQGQPHLSQRVRDVLTPEQWDALRHGE
jgi:uncharacterized coiled-coil protein SlyX